MTDSYCVTFQKTSEQLHGARQFAAHHSIRAAFMYMASWYGNALYITGPLWEESTRATHKAM